MRRSHSVLRVVALCMVLCTLATARPLSLAERIRHVIVVMEENRSFDHMFGWFPGANGLTGKESNPVDCSNPAAGNVRVTRNAQYVNPCDPSHGLSDTTDKIYGYCRKANASMSGFVQNERRDWLLRFCGVMDAFEPSKLPIINTLAQEFVLMDRFFCSLPGPTWPNRLFFLTGTSAGDTATNPWYHNIPGKLYPQKSILDQIAERGGTWKVYYNDTPWELFHQSVAHNPQNLRSMDQFWDDCREGRLPDFGYINPRSGINVTSGQGSNDQHPDHDMALGEAFYKDIYEALRSSPQWNETLFIITYDEHGGFYDHVEPPTNIPAPGDGEESYPDKNFKFDRLGMRIPTLLISPWVKRGTILSEPPMAQRPAKNSEYDLTSVMATVRKIFPYMNKTSPLTKRDAWAATFEQTLMQMDSPRTDCPLHLPDAPAPALMSHAEGSQPRNGLQRHMMTVMSNLLGIEYPQHIKRQHQVSEWLQKHFHLHREKHANWKESKGGVGLKLAVLPYKGCNETVSNKWWVAKSWNSTLVPYLTISTMWYGPLCLDAGKITAGQRVLLTECYPSLAPEKNLDAAQHWLMMGDATIRPYNNQSLCITNRYFSGDRDVYLQPCMPGTALQTWAWHGPALANGWDWTLYYGDVELALSVMSDTSYVPLRSRKRTQ